MMSELADKTLVMIVGPSAIGKSTLMNEVVRIDSRFGRVKSFTTRPPRSNDETNQYFYVSEAERVANHERGEIITDVMFPTTGYHYGTLAASFSTQYCLLDTLANSVENYRALGFARTITISLTTDPESWRTWLSARYEHNDDERRKRLKEAIISIRWSLSQSKDHHWLFNDPNDLRGSAERLIDIVHAPEESVATDAPPQGMALLDTATSLV